MRIYESSGDSDLADCIFADFGLLCDGFQLGYKDAWYTKLWNSYEAAIIPTGEL